MKLNRFCSPRLLAVALAALLPVGAAQATDLQETLKTLNPPVHSTPDMRKAASATSYPPPSQQGAMGPQGTQQGPAATSPPGTDQYKYQTAPSPSPPVTEERSP